MNASIVSYENRLVLGDSGFIRLSSTTSGHICLPVKYLPDEITTSREEEWCFPNDAQVRSKRTCTAAELLKIHIQLGNAPSRQIIPLMHNGGFLVDDELLASIISKCGCASSRMKVHASVANAHLSPFPGYAIYMDVIYVQQHNGHSSPHLFILDSFSDLWCAYPRRISRREN